jgi:outer membrane protein TolC
MKKILLPLICFAFIINNCSAQTTLKLSLKEAIDYALNNQLNVKNATLDEKISKKKVDELVGVGTPQINGSGDLNNFIEIPTSFVPAEFFGGEKGTYAPVKFGQKYTSSLGLTATQLIFDGSYLVGLQASRTYAELSRKQTHATKVETVVNVSKAYYGALVIEASKRLVLANIERITKTLDDTKALYINGFAEKIDADRLQLSYNNLQVQLDNVNRLKDISYALLKFQMGSNPKDSLILTDKLEDFDLSNVSMPDSVDYNKRPDFDVLMTNRNLQELDLKRYKSTYYPSLAAFGNLSANASRNEFNVFDPSKQWYPTAIIGLKLSVPIWDGLQRNSQVQQSRLALEKVDNSINQFKQSIQLEYSSALSTFKTKLASLQTTKENRDLAIEITRVSKAKYENGVGSSLEVTDAESSMKEADANFISTLYDTIVAKIDLDKVTGNINY